MASNTAGNGRRHTGCNGPEERRVGKGLCICRSGPSRCSDLQGKNGSVKKGEKGYKRGKEGKKGEKRRGGKKGNRETILFNLIGFIWVLCKRM